MQRARDDRGFGTVELAVLAPVFFALLAVVVVVGRLQVAQAEVDAAARAAARTLSLARTPHAAVADAEVDARDTLGVPSPWCDTMRLRPTITAEAVTVAVDCEVDLSAAALLPVPARWRVSAAATEVRDRYRERE